MNILPKIDKPCSQDWNQMTGDDKRRFCEHCQLHVHNLSAMSEKERAEVLSRNGERTCIAYVDRDDTLRVHPPRWVAIQRIILPFRSAALFCASVLPLFMTSCATAPTREEPVPADPAHMRQEPETWDGKMTIGILVSERPLWKKILFFWKE